jgi:hypothetical protein
MRVTAVRGLAAALTVVVCQGVAYNGSFCAKVVTFDLSDGANTTALDLQAQALYKQIPRWVTKVRRSAAMCLATRWCG